MLCGIIDAMLQLSRAGRVEYRLQTVNLNTVVDRIIAAMNATIAERGASVVRQELLPAWGNETSLEQVFANLIANALNYLDPKRPGKIEVGMRDFAVEKQAIDTRTYFVKDNGVGIAPAYQDKIFQAFQRVHPEMAKGEGIGLAIVHRVIQRHRGRVWVESKVGEGSAFFVTLAMG